MTSQINYAFRDYANEQTGVGVHIAEVDSAGFDAAVASKASLLSAVEGVSLGQYYKGQMVVDIDKAQPQPASNPASQRELKWLVRAFDTVTYDPVSIEIPCADTSLLDPNNLDRMVIDSGAGATLVTELEAVALSKAGNAIEVNEIVLVGRAL